MFFICAIWMSKQVFTMVSHLFQHLRFFHFNTTHFNGGTWNSNHGVDCFNMF